MNHEIAAFARTLLLVAGLLVGCAATPDPLVQPSLSSAAAAAKAIAWQAWSPEAFARAKRENKLVLVDVGIEGCTACRWMHEETYHSPDIARRIAANFIAVSIDADTQPDLGERYEEWGWPATIFITGDGVEVLALRGSRPPKAFASILDNVIAKKGSGQPLATEATKAEPPTTTGLETMCREAQDRLDRLGDDTGWGGDERIAFAPPVEHAFLRAHAHGEVRLRARGLAALRGEAKLLDPVWGGVFVASLTPTWDSPIVEKRTVQEADALATFAEGFHVTADETWLRAAYAVHRYLHDWMLAPDGTFYSTQQDDAPNLPAKMSGADYYKLPDTERRRYGIPPIDHGVYTDQNGAVIAAYARLYEATGDQKMLAIAQRAATTLLKRQGPQGTVVQFTAGAAMRADHRLRAALVDQRTYLRAQAEFGLALVAIARASGERRWVDAAEKIARGTRDTLEDRAGGGFFSATSQPTDTMFQRRKPFAENIQIARFFNQLYVVTKNAEWRRSAESTLRATATPSALAEQVIWGVAPYALLLDELAIEPIEMTVVTTGSDPRADQLFAGAVRLYEPRKIVRFAKPGKYPDRGRPVLYVCTHSACSKPVFEPAEIARAAAPFVADKTQGCAISGRTAVSASIRPAGEVSW